MKSLKLLAVVFIVLAMLSSFVTLAALAMYGLNVSNDLRNLPNSFWNTIGFLVFLFTIVLFWAGCFYVGYRTYFSLKKLFTPLSNQ
jgi:hypothetical protein